MPLENQHLKSKIKGQKQKEFIKEAEIYGQEYRKKHQKQDVVETHMLDHNRDAKKKSK